MSAIKKVTLAGASGNLGPAILNALVSSNLFNVTVLTRESSKNTFPSGVTVKAVDYSSQESLTSALSGQDALISTLGSLALMKQETLIDAAISAGVKRFIPSEFGSDTFNAKAQKLPVYKGKIDTQAILAERASKGSISYTTIINGPFLDWGIAVGFLGDLKGKKPELVDGGDVKFSSTTVDNIGKAVVGVLSHPEETKNRAVYVKNCDVSQNELVGIAKTILGEDGWAPTNVNSEQLEGEAWADLKAHKYAGDLWVKFIRRAIYGEGFGNVFEGKDNSLLGVPEFGKADLEKIVRDVLEGKGSAKNFTSD